MGIPTSYQWTPANNRTAFPVKRSGQIDALDKAMEARRQHEQQLLVWGLSMAVLLLVIVISSTLRFRRAAAAKEARRILALGPLADPWRMPKDLR